MKAAPSAIIRLIMSMVCVWLLSSCEEQDLAQKNEELSSRLAELKEGVRLLKADIKKGAIVLTSEIHEADKVLKQKEQEVTILKKEKEDLDKKYAQLNRKLEEQLRANQRALNDKEDLD